MGRWLKIVPCRVGRELITCLAIGAKVDENLARRPLSYLDVTSVNAMLAKRLEGAPAWLAAANLTNHKHVKTVAGQFGDVASEVRRRAAKASSVDKYVLKHFADSNDRCMLRHWLKSAQ